MTVISHSHKFVFVHIYKAGGTSVSNMLAPYARLRERVAVHSVGRKIFYASNILQSLLSREELPAGTSSWYMGVEKHAPLSEVVDYLGKSHTEYRIFSVFCEPLSWIESSYNYISIRPLHMMHEKVARMTSVDFVEDFLENEGGLQSRMIKGTEVWVDRPKPERRYLDALFSLDSLSEDCRTLQKYLGLPEKPDERMKCLNRSRGEQGRNSLPNALYRQLVDYVAPDLRIYNDLVAAGGWMSAAEPGGLKRNTLQFD